MKQEDKDLLLKDLCARMPYGVKCQIDTGDNDVYVDTLAIITFDGCACFLETIDTEDVLEYGNIKPYLLPLSSMTEEQEKEYDDLNGYELGCFPYTEEALDYLIKNHFDYRGLIPKGLAIDATNLNIYQDYVWKK